MRGLQIPFPFAAQKARRHESGVDLIGHSYAEDDYITVKVIGLCKSTEGRVVLKRCPGGVVSLPVWLVSSILREEQKERKRAA